MSLRIFPTRWVTCPHTEKTELKLLVLFLDESLSLKNKSCIIEKMLFQPYILLIHIPKIIMEKLYPQALIKQQ